MSRRASHFSFWLAAWWMTACGSGGNIVVPKNFESAVRIVPFDEPKGPIEVSIETDEKKPISAEGTDRSQRLSSPVVETVKRCDFVPCSLCLWSGSALVHVTMKDPGGAHSYQRHVPIPFPATKLIIRRNFPAAFYAGFSLLLGSVTLYGGTSATSDQIHQITQNWWLDPHWQDRVNTLQATSGAVAAIGIGMTVAGLTLIVTNMRRDRIEVKPWRPKPGEAVPVCSPTTMAGEVMARQPPMAKETTPLPVSVQRPTMLVIEPAVPLSPFLIDRSEVSVAQYRVCLHAKKCDEPSHQPLCRFSWLRHGNDPMNCVTLAQATKYCAFVNKRLPSDDEWKHLLTKYHDAAMAVWQSSGRIASGPAPVGTFPTASGLTDLVGNLWQWSANPKGRSWGGSWDSGATKQPTPAIPYNAVAPTAMLETLGFRCAAN